MHRGQRSPIAGLARATALIAVIALGGCSVFRPVPEPVEPAKPAKPVLAAPVATHTFPFDPKTTAVIGELQVTYSHHEDTFPDIARRFNLGFDELVNANPGVDPWLPGEGTRIVLPTQFVLPDAPTDGLVVNLAALRLFYFPKPGEDGRRVVHTSPIGIGKVGWATPIGHDEDRVETQGSVLDAARVGAQGAPGGGRSAARASAAGSGQPARRSRDEPRLAELPDPRHQQARGRRAAREPRLHPHVSGGHRRAVRHDSRRHQGDGGEPADRVPLARRQPVRAVLSAARGDCSRRRRRRRAPRPRRRTRISTRRSSSR